MKQITFLQFFLWRKSLRVVNTWFLLLFNLVVTINAFFFWEKDVVLTVSVLFLVAINIINLLGEYQYFRRLRRAGKV